MKKILMAGAAVGTLILFSTASFAAGSARQRQYNQEKRISQGVRTGAITHQELKKLRREQRHIRTFKQKALRDGYLNNHESARIARMQNKASRHIQWAKNNHRRNHYLDRSCNPYPHSAVTRHRVVAVPRPVPVAHYSPMGYLGISAVQPGWSLALSTNLR